MTSDWVVLELGPKAEGEDPDLIRQSIRHMLRDAEVFIPAIVAQVGGDRVVQYLIEGYAFIRRAHTDDRYYRLEGSKYVQSVLTNVERSRFRSVRRIAAVPDSQVAKLRGQIEVQGDQGIGVGDTVLILSGPYRQIQAQVIEDIPEKEHVQLHVKFRSKEALLTFPRAGLRLVSRAKVTQPVLELPKKQTRFTTLRQWVDMALPLSQWVDGGLDKIREKTSSFQLISDWISKGGDQTNLLNVLKDTFDTTPLQEHWARVQRLSTWLEAGQQYMGALQSPTLNKVLPLLEKTCTSASFSPVETQYMEWLWLQDVQDRLGALNETLEDLEQIMSDSHLVQNIIIDGNNLAIRCGKAPGLDSLKDSQGRPTGAITGFLRSLASLRKRFTNATFYVCWDGSSQRRKAIFSGYKAGRTPFDGYEQIAWLRRVLPSLGIVQLYNEQEEADDVIATLVRGRLAGQTNFILSTDRDLLQLVTETTQVLFPSIAGRPERIYDVALVKAEYNVSPMKMVAFRAMSGDSSDKIPGIPRLPEKTIATLLRMYGSVDGIFAANLPELTKAQQEKIRSSESQVRMNMTLMSLQDISLVNVVQAQPDREAAEMNLRESDIRTDSLLDPFFSRQPLADPT